MSPAPSRSELDPFFHAYNAANFMAQEGEYDLALRLLRKTLEKAHLDRRVGRTADVQMDAERQALEQRLMAEYAACRIKLEEGRKPWMETLAKTAIVTGGMALTFIVCFAFAMSRVDALIASPVDKIVAVLDGAVKSELPRVTSRFLDVVPEVSAQIDKEVQKVSLRMSSYLEKKVDTALDERIGAIVDDKLRTRQLPKK